MPQEKIPAFRYLLLFIVITVLLIVFGITAKVIHEVATSNFRNNSFSLLIVSKDSKLIYIDRDRKSALFLALGDIQRFVKGKNTLEATFSLGVPINGIVIDDKPPANIKDFTTSNNQFRLIFGNDVDLKNLNRYDVFKIMSALGGLNKDSLKEERVDLFKQEDLDEIEDDFLDSNIRNSAVTVAIDNGTSINGLGNLLALILTRQGYNVISVRTAKSELSSFIAHEGEKNSTVDSLLGLTGFEYKNKRISKTSDVTIFLGEDVDAMLSP